MSLDACAGLLSQFGPQIGFLLLLGGRECPRALLQFGDLPALHLRLLLLLRSFAGLLLGVLALARHPLLGGLAFGGVARPLFGFGVGIDVRAPLPGSVRETGEVEIVRVVQPR
ncbi:MAG: hypothetical protein IPK20_19085 [Betaproteobacteria bacterium]|nr:hypothetical protein [Betaproteobacteria bacterium]